MANKAEQTSEVQNEEVQEVSIKSLQEEIEKLKAENEKYYEHLQRTVAEFDNYKKRVSKEKEKIYNLAVGDVITKFISVLDNLEKASTAESTDEKLKEGVISQKEYDYLIQNRTSGLPSYYKSVQFILFLGLVPILQAILFRLSIRLFMGYASRGYLLGNIGIQVILAGIFFLVYKFTKKDRTQMDAV